MLGPAKLVAFVGVKDAAQAQAFYGDALGLKLVSEELPFALVFDANGVMLRVTIVHKPTAAQYTTLGWEVPDISVAVQDLQSRGVRFERYAGMTQDELGIWTSPSGAKVAWFKDPDGNLLSVTEF